MNYKNLIFSYIKNSSSLFNKFYFYKSIDSTNNKCFKIRNSDNFIVYADKQTHGRGRYNRNWVSPAGENLYFSFLIHQPVVDYNNFCILVSVTTLEILEKYHPDICLKWPNDIIYKKKKLCGILIERKFTGNILDFVVAGIGINIFTDFSKIPDLKNIAVSLDGGQTLKILLDFLKLFEKYYLHFPDFKNKIIRKWIDRISGKNETVRFKIKDNIIEGKLKKVNPDGSIIIEAEDRETTYQFGEII